VGSRTLARLKGSLEFFMLVAETRQFQELENSMRLLCVVLSVACASAGAAAQVNSASMGTAEVPTSAQAATHANSTPDSNAPATASGIWLMTWTNEKGDTRHATLNIQQKGEALSGTANVQGGPVNGTFRLTGNVRGNRVVLSVKVYWHHALFTGTVDGGKMSGSTHDGKPWVAAHA
jgi:hypothetical protein